MKFFRATVSITAFFWLLQQPLVLGQATAQKIYFFENAGKKRWCAFSSEGAWKTAVQDARAMHVGTLFYSNSQLSQIDLNEEDESADWTVYDHYFLDSNGQIVKLRRMINVLPGDRSVLQTFLIAGVKARQTGTIAKQLSTGKPLISPKPVWLPKLSIETSTKTFPFSALLRLPNLRTSDRSCVETNDTR